MASNGRPRRPRSLKLLIAWLCTALIIGIYFSLPDGEDGLAMTDAARLASDLPLPPRIEIVSITPSDATPGSAITVTFAGAQRAEAVQAYVGKSELLPVLSR